MANTNQLLPGDKEEFFPKGSGIMLVVHMGIGLFFIMSYFLLYSNIETIKMMILGYYTLFNIFFLFFYHAQLRVRRIFLIWIGIAVIQLFFYFINVHNLMWAKWPFRNVLSTLAGLPVVLALYNVFRRMALQRTGKDLVVGIRTLYKPTAWDFAATVGIPVIVLLLTLF
jgi:hypothetical protein